MVMPNKHPVSRRSLSEMPGPDVHYPICDRFKETRLAAGLNQEDMAAEVGTTLSTVKMIETYRVIPNLHIIKNWHRKFKRSYSWIIEGVGK